MTKSRWIIFIIIVLGFIGLLVYESNKDKADISGVSINSVISANQKNGNIGDYVYGNKDSKVVLIEYGDFECSGCAEENPKLNQILPEYKDKIAFIFRNFPLTSIHQNSLAAAAAAVAAGLQGKFWDYHNTLYNSQSDWADLSGSDRDNQFVAYAKQLSLNTTKFRKDMSSDNVTKKIYFDQALGQSINLDSTPTFVLDGKTVDPTTWSDNTKLKTKINSELKKYNIDVPSV